jgi:hypothetical protein
VRSDNGTMVPLSTLVSSRPINVCSTSNATTSTARPRSTNECARLQLRSGHRRDGRARAHRCRRASPTNGQATYQEKKTGARRYISRCRCCS